MYFQGSESTYNSKIQQWQKAQILGLKKKNMNNMIQHIKIALNIHQFMFNG